ncbi:MAG: hypothetical protein ACD_3C00116G0005 [uncultured bacterium (gcode 4)]|uniref:Galanin n=1 Tax=uncultured bacterium (gcode 4) TaxID=1234023 RepID=K2FYD6_9BACT|nr:MAG: hypothetical protein ACD_3C00116G0005 [uncultured bacterium (gcode 4)]
MEIIDFSELKLKYPTLSSLDITFLNEFFSRKDILDKFMVIEEERRKKMKIFLISEAVLLLVWGWYVFSNNVNAETITTSIFIFIFLSFFIYLIVSSFFRNWWSEIKNSILPKFASEINPDLKYDLGRKYYFWDESAMVSGWLIQNFDRIDLIEDSIIYSPSLNLKTDALSSSDIMAANLNPQTNVVPSGQIEYGNQIAWVPEVSLEDIEALKKAPDKDSPYTIEWYEFKSSERHTDKNWRAHYTLNNHCYLLKVTFNNARQKLTSWMALLRDVNDNFARKLWRVLVVDVWIIMGYFYFTQPKDWDNIWIMILVNLADFLKVPFLIFIVTILIVLFIITYQIQSKILNRNRVKTENSDFEKEFDVYCKDQILSRTILTPSFMYKIYDFTQKIDKDRIYEFFFIENTIYVKLNLMAWIKNPYLEVSSSSDIISNMEKFVEFYIELKNVTNLAKDLWFEYFDKDSYNSQIIN